LLGSHDIVALTGEPCHARRLAWQPRPTELWGGEAGSCPGDEHPSPAGPTERPHRAAVHASRCGL